MQMLNQILYRIGTLLITLKIESVKTIFTPNKITLKHEID